MADRKIAVTQECFVENNGKYLMLKRGPHKRIMPNVWMGPGGHREFCEGLLDCAKREIVEETGLLIKDIRIRATGVAYMKDLDQELYLHLVVASYSGGEVKQDPEDGELVWLTPEEIYKADNLLAELREVLPHVFSNDPKVISYRAVYEKGNDMIEFKIEE